MHRGRWTGILIVALAAAATPALAQDANADGAEALFRRGNELYKEQRWAEAEAAYEEAFRRTRAHDIAANLGYAELYQGKHREAAEHLSFAVRSWAPTGNADKKRYAEERLALAKKEIGTLRIKVNVADAEVLVDGARVGVSPLDAEVFVEAGAHAVEARRAGYREARESVQVGKGEEREVALALEAMPAAVAPREAVAGVAGMKGTPGEPPAMDGPKRRLWPIAVGSAVAAAALGAGAGLTIAANGKSDEAGELRREVTPEVGCRSPVPSLVGACQDLRSAVEARDALSNAALGMFIAGSAVALGTASYALWALSRPREQRGAVVRVTPVAGARGGGVVVRGAW